MHLGRPISLPAAHASACNPELSFAPATPFARVRILVDSTICRIELKSVRPKCPRALETPHRSAAITPHADFAGRIPRRGISGIAEENRGGRRKNPPVVIPFAPPRVPGISFDLFRDRAIGLVVSRQSAKRRGECPAFFGLELKRNRRNRTNESHDDRIVATSTVTFPLQRSRLAGGVTLRPHIIVAKSLILDRSRERSPIAPRAFASEIARTIGRDTRRRIDRKFITADINNSSYNRDATRRAHRSIELSIGQLPDEHCTSPWGGC